MQRDPYRRIKKDLKRMILKQYPTVESFCFENDIHKSTISRLLSGKRIEFKIATLQKIAQSLNKELIIDMK